MRSNATSAVSARPRLPDAPLWRADRRSGRLCSGADDAHELRLDGVGHHLAPPSTPRRSLRSNEWPGAELNRRHRDFQSRALPTELPGPAEQEPLAARPESVNRRAAKRAAARGTFAALTSPGAGRILPPRGISRGPAASLRILRWHRALGRPGRGHRSLSALRGDGDRANRRPRRRAGERGRASPPARRPVTLEPARAAAPLRGAARPLRLPHLPQLTRALSAARRGTPSGGASSARPSRCRTGAAPVRRRGSPA